MSKDKSTTLEIKNLTENEYKVIASKIGEEFDSYKMITINEDIKSEFNKSFIGYYKGGSSDFDEGNPEELKQIIYPIWMYLNRFVSAIFGYWYPETAYDDFFEFDEDTYKEFLQLNDDERKNYKPYEFEDLSHINIEYQKVDKVEKTKYSVEFFYNTDKIIKADYTIIERVKNDDEFSAIRKISSLEANCSEEMKDLILNRLKIIHRIK